MPVTPKGPSHDGEDLTAGDAVSDMLETVLDFDSDRLPVAQKRTPFMWVVRAGGRLKVHKRTYVHERQQLGVGQRIPSSRLEKIVATQKHARAEMERSVVAGAAAATPGASSEEHEVELPVKMLRIGSGIAVATKTDDGQYEWWAGRVQKMKAKTNGKTGRYVPVLQPMVYDDAVDQKVKVICNWYRKHRRYEFTYDGPRDAEEFSLEFALGLLEFEPVSKNGQSERVRLRDPSHGPRLDELLKLTRPSAKPLSKRTRGEEVLAGQAKRARETSLPEDLGQTTKDLVCRALGKRKATKILTS